MSSKKIDILNRGLNILRRQIQAWKDRLEAEAKSGTLLEDDAEWLDTAGNLIDEVYVVDLLASAEDYDRSFEGLEEKHKAAVLRLREAAGDIIKVASEKQKRMLVFLWF